MKSPLLPLLIVILLSYNSVCGHGMLCDFAYAALPYIACQLSGHGITESRSCYMCTKSCVDGLNLHINDRSVTQRFNDGFDFIGLLCICCAAVILVIMKSGHISGYISENADGIDLFIQVLRRIFSLGHCKLLTDGVLGYVY